MAEFGFKRNKNYLSGNELKLAEFQKYLAQETEKNISSLGIIANYGLESCWRAGSSYLFSSLSDQLWGYPVSFSYQSCDSGEDLELARIEFKKLLQLCTEHLEYFASLTDWMLELLQENYQLEWVLQTERFIFKKELNFSAEITELQDLKPADAEFIFKHSHYQSFTSIPYIKERIAADCSAGIFLDQQLVAWGLTHDDGALGFIHVRPEFRQRGFAKLIVKKLIAAKQSMDKKVFLNVELGNKNARQLFTGLGFQLDRKISWAKLLNKSK